MVEINGVAHIILTVTDWQESAKFYRKLLGEFLGLTCVMDGEGKSSISCSLPNYQATALGMVLSYIMWEAEQLLELCKRKTHTRARNLFNGGRGFITSVSA